jgi:uncharacterized protein
MSWIIYVLLGVAVAVLLLTLGASFVFARMFCTPKRKQYRMNPTDNGLTFEPVKFPSNGKSLQGWFMPGRSLNSPLPAVVLTHGWSSNSTRMIQVASALHKAGMSVLLYDVRGHGKSPSDGPITLKKMTEDLRAAIDYLCTREDVDKTHLAAVGHSMGAAATIVAASQDLRIKAAVSSSAFADPVDLTKSYIKRFHLPIWPDLYLAKKIMEGWMGIKMSCVSPKNCISHINIPFLLIHGASDKSILPMNIEMLHANAPKGLTECLLIPELGHSDVIENAEYFRAVVDYINRNLLTRPNVNPPVAVPDR